MQGQWRGDPLVNSLYLPSSLAETIVFYFSFCVPGPGNPVYIQSKGRISIDLRVVDVLQGNPSLA